MFRFLKVYLLFGMCTFFSNFVVENVGAQLISVDSLCYIRGKIVLNGIPVKARLFYYMKPDGNGVGLTHSDSNSGLYELHLLKRKEYMLKIEAQDALAQEFFIPKDSLTYSTLTKDIVLKTFNKGDLLRLDLRFQRGKNIIDEQTASELNYLAEEMKKNTKLKIRLEGHTDYRGSKKANHKLAKDRVYAAQVYLLKKGVSSAQIKTKSFGGSKPITRDPNLKSQNRRVEIRILSK